MSYIYEEYNKFKRGSQVSENDKAFVRPFLELRNRWDPEYYRPLFKELKDKLKDAGAVPLKSVVKIISRRAPILKNKEANVRYVEISNINPKTSELNSFTEMRVHELPSRATFEIKTGDILTAVSGISTGTPQHASAYVTGDFDGCISTNGMRALTAVNVDPFYLLAFVKSELFLKQMLQYRTGAAIPAVADNDLENIWILIPDKKIQEAISLKVKESYNLREKSKQILNDSKNVLSTIIA